MGFAVRWYNSGIRRGGFAKSHAWVLTTGVALGFGCEGGSDPGQSPTRNAGRIPAGRPTADASVEPDGAAATTATVDPGRVFDAAAPTVIVNPVQVFDAPSTVAPRLDAQAHDDDVARPDAASLPCPELVAPSVVTALSGAREIAPDAFTGGGVAQIDLDAPDPEYTYNDPHVLDVAGEYWMYASATVAFDFPVRVYRMLSSDGKTWRRAPPAPVLEPGSPGSWDAGGVETPAVVHFDGRYHLFYTGYPKEVDDPEHSVLDYGLGHAVSCDGVTFTRVGTSALLTASGSGDDGDAKNDWYAFVVAEPGPVVVDGELWLYFTALGVDAALGTSLQVIGLTRSANGVDWSPPEWVLGPDQSLYPRVVDPGPPLAGWVGYSTPNALVLNGRVHLFFDVAYDPDEASWRQLRLHHASSANGRSAWAHDPIPILEAGRFDWARDEVRSPAAIIVGTTLRVYFAGHELDGTAPDHFGIGMLELGLR